MTREERIKTLEALRMEDRKWEAATSQASQNVPEEIITMKLPPLSVFLDAVTENATVKRAQSQVEQLKNEYRLQKRDWLGYLKFNGMYSYGRYNVLSNSSDEYTPMYQTSMTNNQQTFNIGASLSFSLGDILNRPLKLKNYRYQIEQLGYAQDEVMEDRKLKVLEAYNAVTEQLAVIKAKAESAALYNAQMKISENYFIQGRIDIITLSLERARRSAAVVQYEESRVALHNAIVLLEMLTNITVIKEGK
jgi:outer membrane protein TolC